MTSLLPTSVWEQIPIVVIFAVVGFYAFREFRAALDKIMEMQNTYGKERNDSMQKFLAEQRAQDRQILESLIKKVEQIGEELGVHDRKTDMAITAMKERTRPNKPIMPKDDE